jgi:hypothetical protein
MPNTSRNTAPRTPDGLPAPWPADRYEVRCDRGDTFGRTRDLYHFPKNAVESAKALERAGLARRVTVARLADG